MRFLLALICTALIAQQALQKNDDVRILPVKGNIWMLTAGGVNVVASIGKDGILLVNSGPANLSGKLAAAINQLSREVTAPRMPQQSCVGMAQGCTWWNSANFNGATTSRAAPKPIVGIINTSFDPEITGGNAALAAAGHTHVGLAAQSAWIMSHENANPLVKGIANIPIEAAPTETFTGKNFKLNYFNGEPVILHYMPAAHTDGDSVVQFRESDILAAGDMFNMANYPVIDVNRGGSVQGLLDGLNWLLDTAVVEHMMEGGTLILPAHGRIADSADLAYYRDMVAIVRDRVRNAIQKGMTLEQVKAAKLTPDYDGRFGRNPAYTPQMFVEAVYRSLSKSK